MQWFFSCDHNLLFDDNFQFSYFQLMNDGDSVSLQYWELTVYNHCMPHLDPFQIQTTTY